METLLLVKSWRMQGAGLLYGYQISSLYSPSVKELLAGKHACCD